MKKTIISLLLMAAPVAIFAQLTVFSNGSNNVSIKTTAENPYAYLMVSPSTYTSGYKTYSMQGRLANNPSKGVYIKNGRKQIVK